MSRRVHRAPLAVASDGTVLLNVTEFEGVKRPEELLKIALREEGRVLVGLELEPKEVKTILARLEHCTAEGAAVVVAARQRKRR